VEFVCGDVTRAELPYALEAAKAALAAGAKRITLEDAAGLSLPEEITALVKAFRDALGADACLSVRCGNELGMAIACAAAALQAGADEIKTAYNDENSLSAALIAKLFRSRGADLGLESTLDVTRVDRTAGELDGLLTSAPGKIMQVSSEPREEGAFLAAQANEEALVQAITALGYDLDEDDMAHAREAVERESKGRALNRAELEAIILSAAQQVPPTYRLKSYLVNSGNTITPTAHVTLIKQDETLSGLCAGDGPIDAAFLAIEQIIGRHYEMDDFQIAAVTQNREAMGDALVKLRCGGRVYAGKGISTDINGAAIRAYLNALNKIAYEEKTV
jgi:2-isopropylmalate synthase